MSLATRPVTVQSPLDTILGTTTTTRAAAVRDMWAYIRTHNLKRGRYIVLDAKLQPLAKVLRNRQLKNGEPMVHDGMCHFLGVATLVARHLSATTAVPVTKAPPPDAMSVVPTAPTVL